MNLALQNYKAVSYRSSLRLSLHVCRWSVLFGVLLAVLVDVALYSLASLFQDSTPPIHGKTKNQPQLALFCSGICLEVWKSIHLKSFKERIERSEPPPPDERKQRIEDEDIYNEQLVEAIGRAIKLGKSLGDVLEDICDEWHVMLQADEYSKAQDEDKA
jgi:hypothetical protein